MKFVVFKWRATKQADSYVSGSKVEATYTSLHVNTLYEMLLKTQNEQPELICVTDDSEGIHPDIVILPIPEKGRKIIDELGGRYVKLYMFSEEFSAYVKDKFMFIDLDTAICGDLTNLFSLSDKLVVLKGTKKNIYNTNLKFAIKALIKTKSLPLFFNKILNPLDRWRPFGSGLMVVTPNIKNEIWSGFEPVEALNCIKAERLVGTDQAYLYLKFRNMVYQVAESHGIWRFDDLKNFFASNHSFPNGIKAIIFAGAPENKPWSEKFILNYPWIEQFYMLKDEN